MNLDKIDASNWQMSVAASRIDSTSETSQTVKPDAYSKNDFIIPLIEILGITKQITTLNIDTTDPDFKKKSDEEKLKLVKRFNNAHAESLERLVKIRAYVKKQVPNIDELIDPRLLGIGNQGADRVLIDKVILERILSRFDYRSENFSKLSLDKYTEMKMDAGSEIAKPYRKMGAKDFLLIEDMDRFVDPKLTPVGNLQNKYLPDIEVLVNKLNLNTEQEQLVVYYLLAARASMSIWNETLNVEITLKNHYFGSKLSTAMQYLLISTGNEMAKNGQINGKTWLSYLKSKNSSVLTKSTPIPLYKNLVNNIYKEVSINTEIKAFCILQALIQENKQLKDLAQKINPSAFNVFKLIEMIDHADDMMRNAGPVNEKDKEEGIPKASAQPQIFYEKLSQEYQRALDVWKNNPQMLNLSGYTEEDIRKRKDLIDGILKRMNDYAVLKPQIDEAIQKMSEQSHQTQSSKNKGELERTVKNLKSIEPRTIAIEKKFQKNFIAIDASGNSLVNEVLLNDLLKEWDETVKAYNDYLDINRLAPKREYEEARELFNKAEMKAETLKVNDPDHSQKVKEIEGLLKDSKEKAQLSKSQSQPGDTYYEESDRLIEKIDKLNFGLRRKQFKYGLGKLIDREMEKETNFKHSSSKDRDYEKLAEFLVGMVVLLQNKDRFKDYMKKSIGVREVTPEILDEILYQPHLGNAESSYQKIYEDYKKGKAVFLDRKGYSFEELQNMFDANDPRDIERIEFIIERLQELLLFFEKKSAVYHQQYKTNGQNLSGNKERTTVAVFYLSRIMSLHLSDKTFANSVEAQKIAEALSDKYASLKSQADKVSKQYKSVDAVTALLLAADPYFQNNEQALKDSLVSEYPNYINKYSHLSGYRLGKTKSESVRANYVSALTELKNLYESLPDKEARADQIAILEVLIACENDKSGPERTRSKKGSISPK